MPAKTGSSSPLKLSRQLRRASASATSGAIGTERTFPDLGVVSWPPEYGGR